MSQNYVVTNNATSTLAATMTASSTSITLASGHGARFPSPTGGDYTLVTIESTAGALEIICIVGRSGDVLTVGVPGSASADVNGRNYEAINGMSAAAWAIGDVIECRPTAAIVTNLNDQEVKALAGLTSAADQLPYFTGSGTAGLTTLTATARTLLDDTTVAAMRTTLGSTTVGDAVFVAANVAAAQTALALVPGTNVQAQDAELSAIAGLTSAADQLPYFTGSGTAALTTLTATARSILDDASVGAIRTTLGSTAVGDALFVTASAAAARTTLDTPSTGDSIAYAIALG